MKCQTIIKNGKVVIPKIGTVEANICIDKGKIVGLVQSLSSLQADNEIDVKGCYILPGAIEPHAHYGYGGNLKDHFETETASCLIGGITSIILFYRNYGGPPGIYENFSELKEIGEKNSLIDFSFHLGIVNDEQLDLIHNYFSNYGISSFKFTMAYKGAEAKSVGLEGNETDDGFIYEAFSKISKLQKSLACIHAENIEIILKLIEKFMKQNRDGLAAWSDSRPNFTEAESIRRILFFAELTNCPIYFVHVSTRQGLDEIRKYKSKFMAVFAETCPQYLTLTKDSPLGNLGKVNPPLREPEDNKALWKGIKDGIVDTIGTDHCGLRKEVKTGTIWDAKPGFPGSATMLPVLLSEGVNKGRISIERIVEITSFNTAKIFNLYPQKGTIRVGADADLTIVDLNLEKEVEPEMLLSCSDFSLYESWKIKGWPVMTMIRGKIVMEDGKIIGEKGFGQFLRRN